MRKIKFRAHYDGFIYDVTEIMWSDQTAYIVDPRSEEDGETIPLDKITLLQFTGLLDENGKEIYEGDMVRCGLRVGIGRLLKRVEGEVLYVDSCGCFSVMIPDEDGRIAWEIDRYTDFEVIGNVYEHPERIGKYPDSFTSEEQEQTSE